MLDTPPVERFVYRVSAATPDPRTGAELQTSLTGHAYAAQSVQARSARNKFLSGAMSKNHEQDGRLHRRPVVEDLASREMQYTETPCVERSIPHAISLKTYGVAVELFAVKLDHEPSVDEKIHSYAGKYLDLHPHAESHYQ